MELRTGTEKSFSTVPLTSFKTSPLLLEFFVGEQESGMNLASPRQHSRHQVSKRKSQKNIKGNADNCSEKKPYRKQEDRSVKRFIIQPVDRTPPRLKLYQNLADFLSQNNRSLMSTCLEDFFVILVSI